MGYLQLFFASHLFCTSPRSIIETVRFFFSLSLLGLLFLVACRSVTVSNASAQQLPAAQKSRIKIHLTLFSMCYFIRKGGRYSIISQEFVKFVMNYTPVSFVNEIQFFAMTSGRRFFG